MAGRKYPKLTIEKFGEHLIHTGDLDPIYIAIKGMGLAPAQKYCWMLAYWCFYDAGMACYLSDQTSPSQFWNLFSIAANNKRDKCPAFPNAVNNSGWPRGKERRHFRGLQAAKATESLMVMHPDPSVAVPSLIYPDDPSPLPFSIVKKRVMDWLGFGNWIAFKVGDMLDRCEVHPIKFSLEDAMYRDPTLAALMQWKFLQGIPQESTIDDEEAAVHEVVEGLLEYFGNKNYMAPPLNDRKIGFQEVETILCKWKSHVRGHYPLNNDLHEIHTGIKPWVELSPTAAKFAKALPAIPA